MQSLNPLLILVLVPLFKGVIYPSLSALGYRLTPLRCMSAGMVCTGLAFVIIAALQVKAGSASGQLACCCELGAGASTQMISRSAVLPSIHRQIPDLQLRPRRTGLGLCLSSFPTAGVDELHHLTQLRGL